MKNVCWFSRHPMDETQLSSLKAIAGDDVSVQQVNMTVQSGQAVVDAANGADFICAVLPVALLAEVMSAKADNQRVLIPVNARERNEDGEFYFRHLAWDEVKECRYVAYRHMA